jgi:U3 small nucleolar RNA-associated protein 21
VYAAAEKRVIKYFRGKEVGEFTAPDGSELGTMILLGEDIMVLKEDGSGLLIWNTKTGGTWITEQDLEGKGWLAELQNQIEFQKGFVGTTLLHPATYLNKIVVGSNTGDLQLWNTRTWYATSHRREIVELINSELIHTFPHPVPTAPSAITCLVQSPAIDVIGIGYLDGIVHIFDVRQGELVMQMKMEDGSCSSLSFRTGQSSNPLSW